VGRGDGLASASVSSVVGGGGRESLLATWRELLIILEMGTQRGGRVIGDRAGKKVIG